MTGHAAYLTYITQGFAAWFGTYESTSQAAAPPLNVVSLSDGKVVDQWVYPAP